LPKSLKDIGSLVLCPTGSFKICLSYTTLSIFKERKRGAEISFAE
jgi:hypothetical protein